jgi:hypothetical protein
VRRSLKIAAWIAAFAACAGVGAFIASRTDPFPPGVEDPGARPTPPAPTATRSPVPPGAERWWGTVRGRTYHDLFVGGRCRTDWVIPITFSIDEDGAISGTGTAKLEGGLRCDVATAQVQSEEITLVVGGHRRDGLLDLSLEPETFVPGGSSDYGGLVATLPRLPSVQIDDPTAPERFIEVRVSDGGQGTYGAGYLTGLRGPNA